MSRHIALFGGAFDPPHLGHQAVCLYLLSVVRVSEVWWLPSVVHAFGKRTAPFEHRVAMCRIAIRHFNPERVRVTTVEQELPSPQCTVDTVAHLQQVHPKHRFSVAIGSDNLDELHRWKDIERLRQLASFIVVPRSGHAEADGAGALLPEVSSSELREQLSQGDVASSRLDHDVSLYIEAHGLYKRSRGGEQ